MSVNGEPFNLVHCQFPDVLYFKSTMSVVEAGVPVKVCPSRARETVPVTYTPPDVSTATIIQYKNNYKWTRKISKVYEAPTSATRDFLIISAIVLMEQGWLDIVKKSLKVRAFPEAFCLPP